MLPPPLAPLAAWPQFVVWRAEWNAQRNKWDKIPYSPRGYKASSTNPRDWGTLAEAEAVVAAGGYDGIGFVFTEADPFWFLDIDEAYDEATKMWSPIATELSQRLHGAAQETSHSQRGLHIIGTGCLEGNPANKNIPLHLDFFTKERFVALTCTMLSGDASVDMTGSINAIASQYLVRTAHTEAADWTDAPCAEWSGPADDMELLERALRSGQANAAAAFGSASGRATFADLFAADAEVLGRLWPADRAGEPYNASSADQSFANMLAFWTGRDCARIERIMRMSGLARAKWDDREGWLERTILKACGLVREVYTGGTRPTPPPPPPTQEAMDAAGVSTRLDGGLMLYQGQLEHFAGCIYIRALNKILTPAGDLLDQARFNVEFGGHEFVGMDTVGKKTTASAWTAYTENQCYRPAMADRICFRPERPESVVMDSGKALANTYRPSVPDDIEGDPEPFLSHLRRMLPHGEDFDILISWMASVVQNPGMKAQWWPVVQGAEGNFKSFLLFIMAHAVGNHYAHMPNMEKMIRGGSNFNGWIDRKLFLGLDEVYAANRRDFFEGFKTTVTNRTVPIEAKGVEEATGDNRANGMIVTNHQDGVPISGKNRRFAAFFCHQQTPADMARDGMGPAYIANLKDWLLGEGSHAAQGVNYGIRVVASHLRHRAVEARLDPAKLSIRCPDTTSTAAALTAGRGRVEQEVAEAIEEGRVGFAGGWVSSTYLGKLLETVRAPLPHNKRRELMQSLGYDYHPALEPSGRVNNITAPDNGKPRLYVRAGHLALNATTSGEVARLYTAAQDKAAGEATTGAFNQGGK